MNYGELLNNRREFAELKSRFNPADLSSLIALLSDARKFLGDEEYLGNKFLELDLFVPTRRSSGRDGDCGVGRKELVVI